MKLSKDDFNWAASEGLTSTDQAELLWAAFERRYPSRSKFDLSHVAYYFGALIVIAAMGWFMTRVWEEFGGGAISLIASGSALGFILAGRSLWREPHLKVAGGLLFTVAVCMAPVAIYGLERLTGIWPEAASGAFQKCHTCWFLIEAGTVIAGLIVLRFIRFPFLTVPIASSLWHMSVNLSPPIVGKSSLSWNEGLWVSLCFGLAMMLVSFFIDHRTEEDYAFWGYLFGMIAFWWGLTLMKSESEFAKSMYCLINVGLMLLSVLLRRRVFIVFGSIGVFWYLSYLAYRVFKDSMMFPLSLSFLGVVIIYLGITYQRNRERIERTILDHLPAGLRRLQAREGHRM